MKKVDNMQEQMACNKKDWNSKKKSKRSTEVKYSRKEMKKAFDGYTGRLGMAEERISELKDSSESPQIELQRKIKE